MPKASVSSSLQKNRWKDLYVAALLEGNAERVPDLIANAERAIVDRARELFAAAGDSREDLSQEEEALDDALYALHALKSCLQIHGGFAEAA